MSASLVLMVGGAVLLIASRWLRWDRAWLPFTWLVLVLAAAARAGLIGDVLGGGPSGSMPAPWLIRDGLTVTIEWLSLGLGVLLSLALAQSDAEDTTRADRLGLLLVSIGGLSLAAAANDIVVIFAAVEVVSCCAVVMAGRARLRTFRAAAAVQKLAPHLISSLLLLLGLALIYGLTASTNLSDIRFVFAGSYTPDDASRTIGRVSVLGVCAIVLVFAGVGWRLAAVPFHFGLAEMWAADWRSALLEATVVRAAALVVLARLFATALPGFEDSARLVAGLLAGLTFLVAGVRALSRSDVRIMLADLIVLQGGFLLTGLAAALALPVAAAAEGADAGGFSSGLTAALAALVVASVATIGAVSVLLWIGGPHGELQTVDELAGMARTNPWAAMCLGLTLLALSGLPPVIGFWTRWSLVLAALTAPAEASAAGAIGLDAGFVVLTFAAAAGTLFAALGTLRLLEPVLLVGPLGRPRRSSRYAAASAILAAVLIVIASLMPDRSLEIVRGVQTQPAPAGEHANVRPGYNDVSSGGIARNQPTSPHP